MMSLEEWIRDYWIIDEDVPEGEVHFRDKNSRLVGKIINIGEPDAPILDGIL